MPGSKGLVARLRAKRGGASLRGTLAELMAKPWFEPAIPLVLLVLVVLYFSGVVPGFLGGGNLDTMLRESGEFIFVAIGMGLAVISGGIDLSVGAIYGLVNFISLALLNYYHLPPILVLVAGLISGGIIGLINGYLVAYLKGRPFLTTLVMFIILQAVLQILVVNFSADLATSAPDSLVWDFLGQGAVAGIPTDMVILIIVLILGHIVLSRSRPGKRLIAVGSSRRAGRHAGVNVERVLLCTYVLSGVSAAAGGVFVAARLNSASAEIVGNVQFIALAAVVLGGVSISGGIGTTWRILIGGLLVFILTNGFLQMNVPGTLSGAIVAAVLLLAVGVDRKWAKNRGNAIQKIYINPTRLELGPLLDISADSGHPYALNDRLRVAEPIGVDQVQGPEDVIVDKQGRVYSGDRRGWHLRFSGDGFEQREVFGRIGGFPLGMAFDSDDNLVCCIGGMGVYSISPDGEATKLTDETNRSWYKIRDDSRLRLTDDLDIVPDGRIFFSEATERFEAHDWILDGLEGRPNGRVVCYDPATKKTRTVIKDIIFPNGICSCHDGESILIGQTWNCQVLRYWHSGPNQGKVEVFVENLPGYVDNINRASDGTYWIALNGMRSPAFDLAYTMQGFRRRMIKELPLDEWMYPNMNFGGVIKVADNGTALESLWDPGGERHATVTSMREHDGWLYIGGLENNRIGRVKLPQNETYCHCGQAPCLGERDEDNVVATARDHAAADV